MTELNFDARRASAKTCGRSSTSGNQFHNLLAGNPAESDSAHYPRRQDFYHYRGLQRGRGIHDRGRSVLGGKQAALYTEGTGMYVSCYNLLTVGKRFGVPLLLLVSNAGAMEDT